MIFKTCCRIFVSTTLVILMILLNISSIYTSLRADNNTSCIDTYFLAVSEKMGVGEAVPVKICLKHSSVFRVHIQGVEYDESLLNSFVVAGYALNKICKVGLGEVTVSIRSSGSAKGASASLAFAISLYRIYNRYDNGLWSATGVVSIDGFIDAVAGLNEKIAAATSAGIKRVYTPMINGVVNTTAVVPIASLLDICGANVDETGEVYVNTTLLKIVNQFFKNATIYFSEEAMKIAKAIGNENVNKYLDDAMKKVQAAASKDEWYTAASMAYSVYVTILKEYFSLQSAKNLKNYIRQCNSNLSNIYQLLENLKTIKSSAIPFLVMAIDRVTQAKYYLNLINTTQGLDKSIIASAYGRILTAIQWLDLAMTINVSGSGKLYSFRDVKNALANALNVVSSIVEFNKTYSILTLDGLASTRAYLYSRLPETYKQYVKDSLRKLFKIYSRMLDINLVTVPYLYYQYSNYVDDSNSVYLLSMATLESSLIVMVLEIVSNNFGVGITSVTSYATFLRMLHDIVLYELISLYAVFLAALLKLLDVVK
ncbi:hypothetical protein QPL79_01545 [Ignisphaera sp. 4213-co]|uniref:Lon proteolytic domain-containing protein n=1 Tax=Ignisphaera cupida TaxID=3050454 RepID=A0ABD4Z4C0_9CREN|nr:hypothetical protein [Ignisphaera sp. 4213-co]MDK6028049.1 hypothetical protein [Ignisphaera sp. 4213-co]